MVLAFVVRELSVSAALKDATIGSVFSTIYASCRRGGQTDDDKLALATLCNRQQYGRS